MENEMVLRYLTKGDVESPQYREFLEKYHGQGSYDERLKRMLWYWKQGEDSFKVLTASINGELVGQSCAYKAICCVNNKNIEIWWSVDTFVLSSTRGKGVGKKLQGRLHQDCPNFSSAWYSPTNGAIKRKCGAKGILDFPQAYYPVSIYFSTFLELILKKTVNRNITIPHIRLPYFYSLVNTLFKKRWKKYTIEEIDCKQIPEYSSFMEECLKDEGFRVLRTKEYLKWKYVDNPRIRCRALSIKKDNRQVGLVAFSPVIDGHVVMSKARTLKIYESVFTKDSGLTHRDLLLLVANYCRKMGEKLDTILSLQSIKYWPVLVYPRPHTELLSTISEDKVQSGYLTYIDQDME